MKPVLSDLARILITTVVCLAGGWIMRQLGAPAPYMLGSLFGAWLAGGLIKPLQPWLGMPRWLHKIVVLGLATVIGASFSIEVLGQALKWWPTVLAMIIASGVATFVAQSYMHRIRKHPLALSILCTLPGGQADIMAIARDFTDKDYVVALCHLCRVLIVFLSIPALLAFISGAEGVQASYAVQDGLPSMFAQPPVVLAQLIAIGLAGFFGGRLIRLPMPHLLGPLILSLVLHLLGVVHIPRLNEFVLLAQVVVAGSIGARLSRVAIRDVAVGLMDGAVTSVLLVLSFVAMAMVVGSVTGLDVIELILAFIPGGLYEVTLLALIFGYDLAFVAFHHTVRLLFVFLNLPWLMTWSKRREKRS